MLLTSLGGGLLVGIAAVLLYATLGRIAGISGIAFGALETGGAERGWRLWFIAGLAAGGWLALLIGVPPPATPVAWWVAAPAGLLVGYGTRVSNGCTSGHGVCGLANLSPRSLAAVLVFMFAGALSATLLRPLL